MNYFVKSKKQDVEAYKEYVKAVATQVVNQYFNIELDELILEIEIDKF